VSTLHTVNLQGSSLKLLFVCYRGDEEATDSVNDFGDSRSEYKLLRATIRDTLDIVPPKDNRFHTLKSMLGGGKSYGKCSFFVCFYILG
jgi:hypothetical protein